MSKFFLIITIFIVSCVKSEDITIKPKEECTLIITSDTTWVNNNP